MAEHASDNIIYYLLMDKAHRDNLGLIRNWDNLKIAFEENNIWLKDFSFAQINSPEVRSIPFKTIYFSKGAKLYLHNSNLPDRNLPSLLWTPVERGLPVTLPSFNHNFFGIEQKINTRLIRSDIEREGVVMITSINTLKKYIETAPEIRLQKILWTIVQPSKVILFGTPLLPIPGEVLWRKKEHLFPSGYDLELYVLADTINEKLNPGKENWIVWEVGSTYYFVPKDHFKPLSLSSFRLSTSPSKTQSHAI